MWLVVTNDIFTEFFIFLFQLTPKLKKTKEEIMKHKKDSIMSPEIANHDIENSVKSYKFRGGNESCYINEKISSNKYSISWLAYQ